MRKTALFSLALAVTAFASHALADTAVAARFLEVGGQRAAPIVAVSADARVVSLSVGGAVSKPFGDAIAAAFARPSSFTATVVDVDGEANTLGRLEFAGLITEVGMPALDVTSKAPTYMTLKYSPEYTRYKKASGKVSGDVNGLNQKTFSPANFRFTIDGVVAAAHATRVEPIVVAFHPADGVRPYRVDVPQIVATVPEADAAAFVAWQRQDARRAGSLAYMTSGGAAIATVELGGLRVADVKKKPTDKGASFTVTLYCESMKFIPK